MTHSNQKAEITCFYNPLTYRELWRTNEKGELEFGGGDIATRPSVIVHYRGLEHAIETKIITMDLDKFLNFDPDDTEDAYDYGEAEGRYQAVLQEVYKECDEWQEHY